MKHPNGLRGYSVPHIKMAKLFLCDAIGLDDEEAFTALQKFASSANINLEDAAVIVMRLAKAVDQGKDAVKFRRDKLLSNVPVFNAPSTPVAARP